MGIVVIKEMFPYDGKQIPYPPIKLMIGIVQIDLYVLKDRVVV